MLNLDSQKEGIKMNEEKEKQGTPENTDEGDKYETTPIIERAREEREKLEAATAAQKAENDRTEAIMAKSALGGVSNAGQDAQETKMTDEEYAEKFQKGEVNPLNDDGAL